MPSKAVAAIRNAMRGVGFMFSELSIRILAAGTVLTIAAAAYFSISALEWCAVLLASIGAVVVGVIIFGPRFV